MKAEINKDYKGCYFVEVTLNYIESRNYIKGLLSCLSNVSSVNISKTDGRKLIVHPNGQSDEVLFDVHKEVYKIDYFLHEDFVLMSELDPRLVTELEKYPDTKEHLYKAIRYIKEDREYRNGLDEARLALELLCKKIFNTPDKSIERQNDNILQRIEEYGYSQRFINFMGGYLKSYISYNNNQVKHDDGRSIRPKEANLMLKNISALIQLLI